MYKVHFNKLIKSEYVNSIISFITFEILITLVYIKYPLSGEFIVSGDGLTEVAYFEFIKKCLASGELPLWNKYLSFGMPASANIAMRIYYLPAYIFAWMPLKYYMFMFYTCHFSIGATYFYKLLRKLDCNYVVSFAFGLIYLFSIQIGGYRKNHFQIIVAIVYLPVIIYYIKKYLETRRTKYILICCCVMMLQFCGGMLQAVIYSDVFILGFIIYNEVVNRISFKILVKELMLAVIGYMGLIMMQLLPLIRFVSYNTAYENPYDEHTSYFVQFSVHPIKYLLSVFPRIFKDEYQAFGSLYSSELDIEFFWGHLIVFAIAFCLIKYLRRKEYAFWFASLFLFFGWAAIGHYGKLTIIASKVPFLGEMRCQARCLFVVFFCEIVIAAKTVDQIIKENSIMVFGRISLTIVGAIGIFLLGLFIILVIDSICLNSSSFISIEAYYKECIINDFFKMAFLSLAIFTLGFIIKNKCNAWMNMVFIVFICGFTLYEIIPYSTNTSSSSIDEAMGIGNDIVKQIKDDSLFKVYEDFASIDGAHISFISHNTNSMKEIQSYNSYTNFNNPLIYMLLSKSDTAPLNYSGLLTGDIKAKENLLTRNDMLSMLGIKYILDSSEYLNNVNTLFKSDRSVVKKIYEEHNLYLLSNDQDISVLQESIALKKNKFYKVEMSISAENNQNIYFDFYGGEEYDSSEQEYHFEISDEMKEISFILFSGNINDANEDIKWRIINAQGANRIIVKNLNIYELDTEEIASPYRFWKSTDDGDIYINENAKSILYSPTNVEKVDDFYCLYQDQKYTDYLDTAYVTTDVEGYVNNAVEIKNVEWSHNSIKADIDSLNDGFLCFSECYYPGWKVKIDGNKKGDVEMVNGVIMGTGVPKGSHVIEIYYYPGDTIIGLLISLASFIIGIYACHKIQYLY